MKCRNCNFTACSCTGVLICILFGAAIGILFAYNFIPGIVTATWIAFAMGVLTLIFLMATIVSTALNPSRALTRCLSKNTTCLLVGTFGTIISSLAALSIVLTPIFISIITLVAIGAFFFALSVIGIIAILSCIVCEMHHHEA